MPDILLSEVEFNNDFKYDLKIGQLGEKHLANILENKKIEVKTDFQAMKTGNIFVEYSSRGFKSGIATTQADYYCFIISNEVMILIETEHLKTICRRYINTGRDIVGGDMNTSKGLLIPLQDLCSA